jgi:hypothetical protein
MQVNESRRGNCDLSSHEILGNNCVTGRILLLIDLRLRIAYCCAVRDKTDKTFGYHENLK